MYTVRRAQIQQMHRVLSSDRTPAGASLHFRAGSANRQPASVDDTPAAPIPGWAIGVRLPPTVWRSTAGYGRACGVWVGTGQRVSDFISDSRGATRGGHRPVILGPFAASRPKPVGQIERNTAVEAALFLPVPTRAAALPRSACMAALHPTHPPFPTLLKSPPNSRALSPLLACPFAPPHALVCISPVRSVNAGRCKCTRVVAPWHADGSPSRHYADRRSARFTPS